MKTPLRRPKALLLTIADAFASFKLTRRNGAAARNAQTARTVQQALDDLDAMAGLASVKPEMHKLAESLQSERRRRAQGLPATANVCKHMVFAGYDGVGKSTVAQIVADIYRELGFLTKGHLIHAAPVDLVAGYIGQTAGKTRAICQSALDGVLYIDDAYMLAPANPDYADFGREAINVLLDFMDCHADRIVIVLAGYPERMQRLLDSHPGLPSRWAKIVEFPNYTSEELLEMLECLAKREAFSLPDGYRIKILAGIEARAAGRLPYNARTILNMFEAMREAQAKRLAAASASGAIDALALEDVDAAIDRLSWR